MTEKFMKDIIDINTRAQEATIANQELFFYQNAPSNGKKTRKTQKYKSYRYR